jgi:hypothetical protein
MPAVMNKHVRAFNGCGCRHRPARPLRGLVGLAARAQAGAAQLDGLVRVAAAQRLRIGVGADELHALHRAADHVLHGVAAAATDPDHLDLGALVELFFFNHFDGMLLS